MKLIFSILCILIGSIIAIWTTYLQSSFLSSIGISPYGAITIEPLLIVTSFFLGFKITRNHKIISASFIIILTLVSFLTILSTYSKNTYQEIEAYKIKQERLNQESHTEKLIQSSFISLTNRGMGAKSTIKLLDRLQEQQKNINKNTEISELDAIINILSNILHTTPVTASLIFFTLISLTAVFSPSFLFYSAGTLISIYKIERDNKIAEEETKRETIINSLKLTDKQKQIVKKIQEKKSNVEIAKELDIPERVVKSQISRITAKIDPQIFQTVVTKNKDSFFFSNK